MEQCVNKILSHIPQVTNFRVIEYANIYSTTEHVPREHELLYVLDGKITLHWEDHLVYQAMPGDFLLVEAGTRHRDEFALLKGLRILIMQFHWECNEFFQFVNNRTLPNLSYDVSNEVRRRLDFLRSNCDDSAEYKQHLSIQLHSILLLFYFDLIFSFIIFIILFSISISVFIKQLKFNRSTPQYYISLMNANSFNINGKIIDIKDIENVSFNKIHKWELFGEVKESNIGQTTIPVFKYEEKIAEKATQKAKINYSKSIQKSNLGNIIIESKSSKFILKRVDDVENSVKEIKKIIKEKGNM